MIELFYVAIGIAIGVSCTLLYLTREWESEPIPLPKRERIEPEQKVMPMHVFQRIGVPVESVSRIFERCASGEITSDQAADLLMAKERKR